MSRGAKTEKQSGEKYLTFSNGKFVQRVDENTTGAVARVLEKGPNTGKTVHEIQFEGYEGQIYDLQTEASEYGTRLHIFMDVSTVEEPDAKVKISLPLSSGPAKGFLSRVPVLDFNKDVLLKGYNIENKETGRFNSFLVPYQDGKKIEPFYTKENPNGLPKMQQIKVKGNLVWDDTEQLEFYTALINSIPFPGRVQDGEETPAITQADEDTIETNERIPDTAPKKGRQAF
jgi:hypothetical protein